VSVSDGLAVAGTVTYTFFANNTCSGAGAAAGTGSISGTGPGPIAAVPVSATEGPLAAGSYSFQAVFTPTNTNYTGSTSGCEPFTVNAGTSSTATQVDDAATKAAWAGTETTGASAFDTATVSVSDGITATGTVTYTFFANNTCSGAGTAAGTVMLTTTGAVPNSNTESNLAGGSYSFQATYSGDTNYSGSTSSCEPFKVIAIVSQITPTNTTCGQFASGTAATQGPIMYPTSGTTISQGVNPGVIFYWVKVTVSSPGSQTFHVTETTTYSPTTGTKLFGLASGSFAYDGSCNTLATTITGTEDGLQVFFTATTAGTYFIGLKYSPKDVVGSGPAATSFVPPFNYLYTFATTGVAGSTSTVAFNHT
jgi:hypothetical protein